ncbi:MAG: DUF1697 domain-containing protein [Comamonadaceae bacterium]|nr:MAG: DUF1697 domain-containing protein [Comamonadaceae bacterium]
MARHVALLRGVNVNGITIKSADLKALFVELGFGAVRTVLASGNVLFDTDEHDTAVLRARIEQALRKRFGYEAWIVLLTQKTLVAMAAAYPFERIDEARHPYIVCTLSNGNIGLLTEMAKNAGLPWDCVLSAEVFKAYKPDPRTYLGVAAVFDLSPGQVMLAAAHQDDLTAARACGLRTAYIERRDEFGAARPKDVSPHPDNTLHARDIGALADLLGC